MHQCTSIRAQVASARSLAITVLILTSLAFTASVIISSFLLCCAAQQCNISSAPSQVAAAPLFLAVQVDFSTVQWGTYLNIMFWNLNVSCTAQLPTLLAGRQLQYWLQQRSMQLRVCGRCMLQKLKRRQKQCCVSAARRALVLVTCTMSRPGYSAGVLRHPYFTCFGQTGMLLAVTH